MTPPRFTTLTARAAVLLANDIDTDQIIPARFLKVTDKAGLGPALFTDFKQAYGAAFPLAQPTAVGAAGIERGWSGLNGIHVAKNARRKGFARMVSEALIGFAHAKGARRAWLQVEQNNASALPLYDSLGFRTWYAYHHRVQSA